MTLDTPDNNVDDDNDDDYMYKQQHEQFIKQKYLSIEGHLPN